jgi:hypothetical protein
MTIEKIPVKKSASTLEDKPTKKPRAKKTTTKKPTTKSKSDKKVEQSVIVNVGGKGRGRKAAPKNVGFAPYPTYNQPTPSSAIAKREVLVQNPIDAIIAPKAVVADPTNYLEGKAPRQKIPVAVKPKKGQNPYNVEVELDKESFEIKPTAKGKGLAENVEQQTEVKIQVDKPKGKQAKIVIDKGDDFVSTDAGNTNKVISYDTQAEGTLEENAEKGMTIKDKPAKSRGRPKKVITEEEEAIRRATLAAAAEKKAEAAAEKQAKKIEAEAQAERSSVKEKIAAINKKTEEATITTFEPIKGMKGRRLSQGQKFYDEENKARAEQGKPLINSPFLEGETTIVSFNDNSLGKFTNTNDAPADSNVELVYAGTDLQNYQFA